MSAQERSNVITRVEQTQWGKRRLLAQLQVPRSTYYRWRARESREATLPPLPGSPGTGSPKGGRSIGGGQGVEWMLKAGVTVGYRWVSRQCTAS